MQTNESRNLPLLALAVLYIVFWPKDKVHALVPSPYLPYQLERLFSTSLGASSARSKRYPQGEFWDDDNDGGGSWIEYEDDDRRDWGRRNRRPQFSRSSRNTDQNFLGGSRKLERANGDGKSTDTSHFYSKKHLNDASFRTDDGNFESLCDGAEIVRPSRIQALAWPKVLSGRHTIIADQTGSGKTLSYLLPLLQRSVACSENNGKSQNGSPKILVLAPTAELADQIRSVCSKLSRQVPFKTMVVTATGRYTTSIRDQIRMIQRQPFDVLISTPGRISTILRTRNSGLDLSQLQAIVLDEVDILFQDETFAAQLNTVGNATPLEQTQFVFVTATLPNTIVQKVEKEFPGVVQVRGPGLHRVAPTVKERLVDVSVPPHSNRDASMCFDIKAKQLLKALRQNRCRRTLVFCNTVESCRKVENLLSRSDRRGQVYEVGSYHNAMTPAARNKNMATFAKGRRKGGARSQTSSPKRSNHRRKSNREDDVDYVLICTDRAARGVDFDAAAVDHVVIFDFPKDPAEYVRRVGRTARAGRTGSTTVFAYGWQLPVARKVMGSKLDSFAIAADDLDDDNNEYSHRRSNKRTKSKEFYIKADIEGGRLWDS